MNKPLWLAQFKLNPNILGEQTSSKFAFDRVTMGSGTNTPFVILVQLLYRCQIQQISASIAGEISHDSSNLVPTPQNRAENKGLFMWQNKPLPPSPPLVAMSNYSEPQET